MFSYCVFLLFLQISRIFCCSCGPDSFSKTREQAINDSYNSESTHNVYTAIVRDVYCKCYPHGGKRDVLRCIHGEIKGHESIIVTDQLEMTCRNKFNSLYYSTCDNVKNIMKTTSGVDGIEPQQGYGGMDVVDTSNEKNCGMIRSIREAVNGKRCDLTEQPCYYTLTISQIYKGNDYKTGDVIDSSGPDALTSCGDPTRILAIGEEYMIGLGSTCSLIQPWRPISSYTRQELLMIQQLKMINHKDNKMAIFKKLLVNNDKFTSIDD